MKQPLDNYDALPQDMVAYISNYGFNFNKRACEYAVKLMKKKSPSSTKPEPIEPWTKEQVDELLQRNGVKLENNTLYNYVYVANMCKADFYKSSIPDEAHVALYIKDVIDDADTSTETVFRKWLAAMVGNGMGVEWSDVL